MYLYCTVVPRNKARTNMKEHRKGNALQITKCFFKFFILFILSLFVFIDSSTAVINFTTEITVPD